MGEREIDDRGMEHCSFIRMHEQPRGARVGMSCRGRFVGRHAPNRFYEE